MFREKLQMYDVATNQVNEIVESHFGEVAELCDGRWKSKSFQQDDGSYINGLHTNHFTPFQRYHDSTVSPKLKTNFMPLFCQWIESQKQLQNAFDQLTPSEKQVIAFDKELGQKIKTLINGGVDNSRGPSQQTT